MTVASIITPARRVRAAVGLLAAVLWAAPGASAQNVYTGALGGIATLSADGRPILTPSGGQVALFKPQNGGALSLVAGWDFSRYVSLQANYMWNRNDLTLVSTAFGPAGTNQYEETRSSQTSSVIGDLLVYMRRRGSRVRPYLSCGTGVEHFASSMRALKIDVGSPPLPPPQFSSNDIALRVAVGIDVKLRGGWAFRYTFGELLTSNPISDELTPPGQRALKNFQSLFGVIKHF